MNLSPPIASMPDATLVLPAPAKLNLFLHITGRRADGYHELQTLFHFLEACDWLGFRPRDDGHIGLHSEIAGVAHDSNLIVRAARLLQAHSRTTQGADIWLDKHLPMGGGLGGGSSDAATTLLGLNHLWRLGLSLDELAALGLQLGADVPVFVRGQTAFAEGVGERLTPVELEESWYLVLIPDVFVSTAEIFSAPELTRNTPIIKFRGLPKGGSRNDCQPVVEARYPAVAAALKMLGGYTQATMTGTGACVFGSFPNREDADKVSRQLPVELKRFVTKSCNLSKVHSLLQRS